jgi:hypothetical protein
LREIGNAPNVEPRLLNCHLNLPATCQSIAAIATEKEWAKGEAEAAVPEGIFREKCTKAIGNAPNAESRLLNFHLNLGMGRKFFAVTAIAAKKDTKNL